MRTVALSIVLLSIAALVSSFPLSLLSKRENALVAAVFGGVSDGCKKSLYGLALDGDVESCLHLHDFAKTLYSVNRASESIVDAVQGFLSKDICKSDACSADAINAAQSVIQDNCADDLANDGGLNVAYVLQYLLSRYTPAREALCLQDATNQTFATAQQDEGAPLTNQTCVAQQMRLLQSTLHTNVSEATLLRFFQTEEEPLSTLVQGMNTTFANSTCASLDSSADGPNITKPAFCNDCTKAIATSFLPFAGDDVFFNQTRLDALRTNITSLCGPDFLNGTMPDTVFNGTFLSPSRVRAPDNANGTVEAATLASNDSPRGIAPAAWLLPLLLAGAVATIL